MTGDSARWRGKPEPDEDGPVYQCLNLHPADKHHGKCEVDGCPYGPKPKSRKR